MRKIVAHKFVEKNIRCGPWRRKGERYDINGEDQLRQGEQGRKRIEVYFDDDDDESSLIEGLGKHNEINNLRRAEGDAKFYTLGGALGNGDVY